MPRPSGTRTDLQSAIYNPGLLTREALTRSFVARKQVLLMLKEELLSSERHTAGPPHRLFYGPRGMGKTTLLLRLQYLVEDELPLSRIWTPVSFVEERYGIGDLADFWLEVLRGLPGTRHEPNPEGVAERLKDRHRTDAERLSQAAFDVLKKWTTREQKQLLLLIDNLNEVFHHIHDERQLHMLRSILMESPWIKLIGFSPTYFEQLEQTDAPFYEFFSIERLETISLEETREILAHWSQLDERPELLERLTHRQGRIKNLHTLTGGNPRLVAVMYELLKEGPLNSTLEDVQKLVDRMTPYFKAQVDGLPVASRRLVDALAKRWNATSTRELAEELRLPSNQVSAQLSRLKRDGWIISRGGDGKQASHQLADRFYNIYHLMRHARSQMQRLKGFVFFLQVLFEDEDLKRLGKSVRQYIDELPAESREERALQIARLSMIAEASTDAGQKEQLYRAALQHARSMLGSSERLEELVDLPLAQQLLGENRIRSEEQIRSLEAERITGKISGEKLGMLASHYLMVGEPKQAEECLLLGLRQMPGDALLLYNLAITFFVQQRFAEAEETLCLIETDALPRKADCANLRGALAFLAGRLNEALALLRAALEYQWKAEIAVNLADTLMLLGQHEEARAVLEKNAEGPQASPRQLLMLHQLAQQRRDKKKAMRYLRRAADMDTLCQFLLSAHLRAEGRTTEAKKVLKKAQERLGVTAQGSQFYVLLYRAFESIRAWEEAEALARHQEQVEGHHRGLGRYHRIVMLAAAGQAEEAERTLQDALVRGLSPQVAAWWGEKLLTASLLPLAVQCGLYAIRQDNDLPKGYLVLAGCYLQLGKLKLAYRCVLKSQSLDSGISWGMKLRSVIAIRLGRWQEALEWAERASAQLPADVFCWWCLLEAAHQLATPAKRALAEQKLQALLSSASDTINLSHHALQFGFPHTCAFLARLSTEREPSQAIGWNNYAAGLLLTGRIVDALDAVQQALTLDKRLLVAWNNYFRCAQQLERIVLVEEGVQRLLADSGLELSVLQGVSKTLSELGLHRAGLQLVQGGLSRLGQEPVLLELEVRLLLQLSHWDEAYARLIELRRVGQLTEAAGQQLFLCACVREEVGLARELASTLPEELVGEESLRVQLEALMRASASGWPGLPTYFLAIGSSDALFVVISRLLESVADSDFASRLHHFISGVNRLSPTGEGLPFPKAVWTGWSEGILTALSGGEPSAPDAHGWEEQLEAQLMALEASEPELALSLWQATALLLEQARPEESAWCWNEALRLAPDHVDTLSLLSQQAEANEEWGKQNAFLQRLRRLEPDVLEHSVTWILNLCRLGQPLEAEKVLKPLVKANPLHIGLQLSFLNVLWMLRRDEDATEQFQRIIHMDPLNPRPWILGYHHKQLRRAALSERLEWLDRGLQCLPDSWKLTHAWAKECLLYLPASGKTLEQVESRVTLSFDTARQTFEHQELQALLRLRQGRWREALGLLDAMLSNLPAEEHREKALMDVAMRIAAAGKPSEVYTVLAERGMEERWQPLLLALKLADDPHLERSAQAPQEVLQVALELRDSLPSLRF